MVWFPLPTCIAGTLISWDTLHWGGSIKETLGTPSWWTSNLSKVCRISKQWVFRRSPRRLTNAKEKLKVFRNPPFQTEEDRRNITRNQQRALLEGFGTLSQTYATKRWHTSLNRLNLKTSFDDCWWSSMRSMSRGLVTSTMYTPKRWRNTREGTSPGNFCQEFLKILIIKLQRSSQASPGMTNSSCHTKRSFA